MANFMIVHIPAASSQGKGEELFQQIARLWPGPLRMVGSVSLIQSKDMADTIRDTLCACLPSDDALVVVSIGDQGAWRGLPDEHMRWLAERL